MNEQKIGIVGLGKLGLPMMAAFYDRGFSVKGFDIDKSLIELLRSGVNPYAEPGIDQIMKRDPLWAERFFDDFDEFIDSRITGRPSHFSDLQLVSCKDFHGRCRLPLSRIPYSNFHNNDCWLQLSFAWIDSPCTSSRRTHFRYSTRHDSKSSNW